MNQGQLTHVHPMHHLRIKSPSRLRSRIIRLSRLASYQRKTQSKTWKIAHLEKSEKIIRMWGSFIKGKYYKTEIYSLSTVRLNDWLYYIQTCRMGHLSMRLLLRVLLLKIMRSIMRHSKIWTIRVCRQSKMRGLDLTDCYRMEHTQR